jgi:tRNA(Ile)-lysidine synthase
MLTQVKYVRPGATANHHNATLDATLRLAPPEARTVLRALIAAQTRHQLVHPGDHLLIAVSGGADSVCLLHALHQLAPHWDISLHVAHLDHALRPESAADARFVAALAERLRLPFTTERLASDVLNDDPRGMEAAARSLRYAFLRRTANRIPTPVTLATAHHQDDQAETLLLHLVQGSGLDGLAGMAWVGTLPDAQEPSIPLVRPLLATSRADILAYLQSYGLTWCEDSTNLDTAHPRNRLRHQALPLLAEINPQIRATLARTADLLAAEAAHAEDRDRAALALVMREHMPSTRTVVDLFHMAQLDLATQRGVLRRTLLDLGVDLRDAGMAAIETLLDQKRAAKSSGPHPLVDTWAWTVIRQETGNLLAIHRAGVLPLFPAHPHFANPLSERRAIPTSGTTTLNEWTLHSRTIDMHDLPTDWRARDQSWRCFCDHDQAGDLYLATFRPGMEIAPLGMNGHKRLLGDIFTDHKIATYLRSGWPIVVNGKGETVWLCGLSVSETTRIQHTTRHIRWLHWQREMERNS